MKYLLLFIVVAVLTHAFAHLLTKQERYRVVRNLWLWLVPCIVGAFAVAALLFFNLNFNGKII